MGKKDDKTNVMRVLDGKKIPYEYFKLEGSDGTMTGVEMAKSQGFPVEATFKTLVTRGAKGQIYVFMIPVAMELNLKRAARAVGEKSIAMILSKELLPLTGYIHGGCSPIGMKKQYPTVIHESAFGFDAIYFSAGKIGYQVRVSPEDLSRVIELQTADVAD